MNVFHKCSWIITTQLCKPLVSRWKNASTCCSPVFAVRCLHIIQYPQLNFQSKQSQMSRRKASTRPKTKHPIQLAASQSDQNLCTTYATADGYIMNDIIEKMLVYSTWESVSMTSDIENAYCFKTKDVSLLRNPHTGYLYFFREGAMSFWNISNDEIKKNLEFVKQFETEPYPTEQVEWESEQMEYTFAKESTKFNKDCFVLCESLSEKDQAHEMYSFSNALVMSVKLAQWEHSLEQLIQSLETLPAELIVGSKLSYDYKSSKAVLHKIGEVFLIRHRINLQYSLLDVPDVYWDRENLEKLYCDTAAYLNVAKRTRILNEKLSYCAHMVELVKSHLAEQKSLRVEILIVALILIEVMFEVLHVFVKPWLEDNRTDT